ncbi:MAG: response regulator [Solirubrobacterales bacterium]
MEPTPPRPERILLVDDDDVLAGFIRVILERDGGFSNVVIAEDPVEVLAQVDTGERFDLIITKLMLRRIDGYELVEQLRARPATATTPILFLTARLGPEHVARCYAAGANDQMNKPFTPDELLAHVRALLGA